MNWKLSLTPRRARNAIAALVGLLLLVTLAFSFNVLFASRSQEVPQTAQKRSPTPSHKEVLLFQGDPVDKESPTVLRAENDWETYTSKLGGYSIQFPKGWYLDPGTYGATIATFNPDQPDTPELRAELAKGFVKIFIVKHPDPLLEGETLEQWMIRNTAREKQEIATDPIRRKLEGLGDVELGYRRVTVGNAQGFQWIDLANEAEEKTLLSGMIFISTGNNSVLFISANEKPLPSQYHDQVDQILASFRLTSQ